MTRQQSALLELQPDNPKTWRLASLAASGQHQSGLALERHLHASELARQQRADAPFARSAGEAAVRALNDVSHLARETVGGVNIAQLVEAMGVQVLPACLVEQATALAPEVEPAVGERAARLLPAPWVQPLQPRLQFIAEKLASWQQQPRQRHTASMSGLMAASADAEAQRNRERQVSSAAVQAACRAGCGRQAVGLRRCGRCHSVA